MIDPITGTGLASSIITIVQVGYKISKRTAELSRLLGDLPPDLQSCKDLVDILVRCAKRLQGERPQVIGVDAIYGPPTELQADLEFLFTQCYETATTLFELLGGFEELDLCPRQSSWLEGKAELHKFGTDWIRTFWLYFLSLRKIKETLIQRLGTTSNFLLLFSFSYRCRNHRYRLYSV